MILKDIEIELSSLCNAKCPGCTRTIFEERGYPFEKRNITYDEIVHIFEDFPLEHRSMYMCGVMGDPLANIELDYIISYLIYEKNIGEIRISTNAGLRDKRFWQELGRISTETNKLKIKFAIDGVHSNDYRVGVDINRAKENMFYYVAAGGKATWSIIKFDYNLDQIDEAAAICKEKGIIFETRTAWKNTVVHDKNQKTTKIKTVNRPVNRVDIEKESVEKKVFDQDQISCKHYENHHIFISSSLRVFPCCYLHDESLRRPEIKDPSGYDILQKLMENDKNNLRVRNLQDICTDRDFINGGIKKIWEDPNKNLARCWRSCGDCGDRLNKLEVTNDTR